MTVLVLQLASPPVLLILSDAGSSFSAIEIRQTPARVDLKRHSIIIKQTCRFFAFHSILHNCITSCMQATHKTSSSTCNVVLSSILLHSNRITLQTPGYRVLTHAIWPIKMRHSHEVWDCDKFLIRKIKISSEKISILVDYLAIGSIKC